ncbi:hypothetical protein YTPLAS18_37450 [Nitrospira sp.]|nr:hypothetical protein YTPLAS18_37450 [Nitrospira sp.]
MLVSCSGALLLGALFAWSLSGCQSPTPSDTTIAVHDIQIRDGVSPLSLFAGVGDEIRWRNDQEEPVLLVLLETRGATDLSCNKGFSWFGQFTEHVTIEPHKSVSLCFSKPGTIRYNVWLDVEDQHHSMSPTGHVRIQ